MRTTCEDYSKLQEKGQLILECNLPHHDYRVRPNGLLLGYAPHGSVVGGEGALG